ncbi:TonB-dependent receptor [Maribacter sp.]|nr:TonB-dependent receptor [Maribacter sp.]
MQKQITFLLLAFFGIVSVTFGQDDEEKDLGTETVTVTKAYSPTISDAFKIKSFPNLNDSIVLQKKKIEYNIFSVPVASTFSPAKGKASTVTKIPPPELYNSYASAGGGNPANILAKFYTSRTLDRESGYTVGLEHNSSRGNIKDTELDNIFSRTRLDGNYKKRDRDVNWGFDVGAQHQMYNWYGLPTGVFDEATINGIDERQNYFMAEAGGHINVSDSYFKKASLQYRRFWDAVKSGENRVIFEPGFNFPLGEESLDIDLKVDYVNGNFKNAALANPNNDSGFSYSNLQIGINPSLTLLRDDLALNLGVNLVYGLDGERSENNFYIYPAVTASYRLLDEFAIAYAGIEGELKQNSYYGFVEQNPFVSPTLTIVPTDRQYDAYLGLRGQLLPNLSYNVKGSYTAENRRPLFKLNPQNVARGDEKGYNYGNSFEVFYDDIKTLGIFGELNIDVNRNFTLGINGEYYNYNTETDNPAWNLPEVKASVFMDYQIGEKWYMGANLFFVGERQDVATIANASGDPQTFSATIVDLDSFFDANAHVGHRLNDQLSIFVKAANIANNNYQRWANTPVQGLQVLGGATYKFDF